MPHIKKAAIVTGGSGEIGKAICERLAREGWLTAVCYNKDKSSAEELVRRLQQEGLTAKAFWCDVTDRESMERCVQAVNREFGTVELLVNNAGKAHIGLFTEMTSQELESVIITDLLGAMELSRAVLPQMIREHRGAVVNIASVWGECGASCEVAYSAAKSGLIGFTKALAKEVAPSGIRVNCVSLGLIDTKMNSMLSPQELDSLVEEIPAGRMGRPQDAANAVAFLAGEEAEYIQGQVIRVDGGWI